MSETETPVAIPSYFGGPIINEIAAKLSPEDRQRLHDALEQYIGDAIWNYNCD